MGDKSIDYAEKTLGVHSLYADTQGSQDLLTKILHQLVHLRTKRREAEEALSDHEAQFLSDERGKHPSMSATAMKDHIKVELQKDKTASDLRRILLDLNNKIDRCEYDRVLAEHDVKVGVARMYELGGYFQYLAAVKQSRTPHTPSTPVQEGEPA